MAWRARFLAMNTIVRTFVTAISSSSTKARMVRPLQPSTEDLGRAGAGAGEMCRCR